jgi:hypothetical protein
MYRSHNKKIKLLDTGPGYELFLLPENAQHIIDRADHHSHQVTLLQVINLASAAYYINWKDYTTPEPHSKVMGLVKYDKKYYQIVAYLTELPSRRCILESCHVLNDDRLLRWCRNNDDLLKSVSPDASRKKPKKPRARPSTR